MILPSEETRTGFGSGVGRTVGTAVGGTAVAGTAVAGTAVGIGVGVGVGAEIGVGAGAAIGVGTVLETTPAFSIKLLASLSQPVTPPVLVEKVTELP